MILSISDGASSPFGVDLAASQPASLVERLHLLPADNTDPIPPHVLRKYVAYARKFVRPVLSPAAKTVLGDFYLTLRKTHHGADGAPITTRQLEATIRLAEARARAELRETVTEQDARDVIEIIKASLADILEDEHGLIDFRRGRGGGSKQKVAMSFMKALKKHVDEHDGETCYDTSDLKMLAIKLGIEEGKFYELLTQVSQDVAARVGRVFPPSISRVCVVWVCSAQRARLLVEKRPQEIPGCHFRLTLVGFALTLEFWNRSSHLTFIVLSATLEPGRDHRERGGATRHAAIQ